MKSYGYCTSNENGVFEVNYTLEDNLLSKLFNWKRDFRFTCEDLNKHNFKQHMSSYEGLTWLDEEGNIVKKHSQLKKIIFILRESIVVDRYLSPFYK
tara:strand:+ start:83900 stop:84190 length:291 start_codon:yes stop_codon:yes gene_type:complete